MGTRNTIKKISHIKKFYMLLIHHGSMIIFTKIELFTRKNIANAKKKDNFTIFSPQIIKGYIKQYFYKTNDMYGHENT